ncbi:MAG: glycosyltransferase [Terrimicrobiaceae bacterium]
MKIIILNDYATVRGGADQVAIAGARAAAEAGHNVLFFAGCGDVASEELEHDRITVRLLGGPDLLEQSTSIPGMLAGMWSWKAAKEVEKILEGYSPGDTVLHIHGWTKALTASIFPVARRKGFRPAVTLHDYFIACPNGAFFDFPAAKICRRIPLSLSCLCTQCDRRGVLHKGWRSVRQVIQAGPGGLPRHLDHAILISRHSESVLDALLPSRTRRHFVPNPIEIKKQVRANPSASSRFLFIGRLTVEKAADHLAEAAVRAGIEARFAGDGYLKEKVLTINPHATVTGWLKHAQVNEELRAARVLVFPSIWHETFGLTVAEALAHGVPIVVSDASAAAEQVVPGVNGLLYRAGDIGALANALASLKDDALVEKLSVGAYEKYWKNPPSPERHASELLKVYELVLASQMPIHGS